jgi:multiple sugar transport system permease protein
MLTTPTWSKLTASIVTTSQLASRRLVRSRGLFVSHWSNVLWVLPFLSVFLAMLAYPLVNGMWLSLGKSDMFSAPRFVGLSNYGRLFQDKIFLTSIWNTLAFTVMTVPAFVVVGLALALALNREGPLAAAFRTFFFGTTVLSVTIVALIWKVVYMPEGGPLALLLQAFGLQPIPFLNSPQWALASVALTTVWWGIGLPMVLFLAALQQIPRDVYEAAALDNASPWDTLWQITMPAIRRTTVLVVIIQVVLQFQVFSQIQLMTNGGPNNSSRSIAHFIYNQAFQNWDVGYAAAASEVLFALILIPAMAQYWLSRGRRA